MADNIALPLLGTFLGALAADLYRAEGIEALYGVLSGLGGVALLISVPFFFLDVIQVRRGVQPGMLGLYELNSIRSLGVISLSAILLLWLGVSIWRARRSTGRWADSKRPVFFVGQKAASDG